MALGTLVLVDQFIDGTFAREKLFLALAASRVSQLHSPPVNACPQPVSERLPMPASMCIKAAPTWRWKAHSFPPAPKAGSTVKAGADVIGMTNMPEAKLAREA